MKTILLTTLLMALGLSAQVVKPVEVELTKYKVYVPSGFDTNDSSEIIVSGLLPNHCYQSPKVEIDLVNDHAVKVKVKALYLESQKCLQVQIPYSLTVTLGVLEKGLYSIINQYDNQTSALTIDQARTIDMDDSIYANVEYIEENDYDRKVKLVGSNPSDCFELDRIEYVNNGKDTYSVLPILKVKGNICPQVETPFEYEFEVPKELDVKVVLIHVRKMNGKSVNKLYRNKM